MTTQTPWDRTLQPWFEQWTRLNGQLWGQWLDQMQPASDTPASPTNPEQIAGFWDLHRQSLDLWHRSWQLWQDLWPKIQAGEDWQSWLAGNREAWEKQWEQFRQQQETLTQDQSQWWQRYLQELPAYMTQGMAALTLPPTPAGWEQLSQHYEAWWHANPWLGLYRSPLMGPNREHLTQLLQGFEAWQEHQQAAGDYQTLLVMIQQRSWDRFLHHLADRAAQGDPLTDPRQLSGLWSSLADQVFEETFLQEENLKIRGRFLNTLNRYRQYQQSLLETYLESQNLPTRSELDEVHKNIYELRKQLRQQMKEIKQELDGLKAQKD